MYSAVRTHDYPESEMDDLESLYFDTISLADSEAAANVMAAHRKSLSQSRNTVYHSAVDLAADEMPSLRASVRSEGSGSGSGGLMKSALKYPWSPGYRHSSALESYKGGGDDGTVGPGRDYADAAIAAQVISLQNGHSTGALRNSIGNSQMVGGYPYAMHSDEVSRHLLQNNINPSRDKKLPVTYSQWKSRTHRKFQDGIRSVDFVLAYRCNDYEREHEDKRRIFEENLIREGLQLESDTTQKMMHFVKVHAPLDVLCRYAEILKLKLPIKEIPGQELINEQTHDTIFDCLTLCWRRLFPWIKVNEEIFPQPPSRIFSEYSRNYHDLFDQNHPNFFESGTRNTIINCILERQRFTAGEETPDNMGIDKLLEDGVYDSAYPLHDDEDRQKLLDGWADMKNWMSLQPLDKVKEYFGAKVAIYFAWLGFYTHMLIPVSICGIFCFLYGFLSWNTNPITQEICNDNSTIMCPQCDRNCNYWRLNETCNSAKINSLIDNKMTVVFSVIMSVWAVIYLEMWKRYSAGLVHRWGLTGFSQQVEHPRPQYLAKIAKKLGGKEPSSSTLEPEVPFWRVKFLPSFTSYSITLLFICVSLIAIFSMVIYRMAQKASHSIIGNEDSMSYKIMLLPMTAGIIDLILISILDYAYSKLAVHLTNLEYCRTSTEYDESLTIKNYIFQFVNYYSSLFYIAFLKGKFVGYPSKYNRIFGFRQEECSPGGCLMELCMQLFIIMVGKQAVNCIVEMLVPYLMKNFNSILIRFGLRHDREKSTLVTCNQYTKDYQLLPWMGSSMFSEYLEMVLQFGFIILFGLAFPLAPLLALINNVVEVRCDALKMLRLFRRPVAQRARDIGVWYNILSLLTRITVASNAMIIAFSTNLIPTLVYRKFTHDESLNNYLNFTLAYFNTSDFQVTPILPDSAYENITTCRYNEFRNPPWYNENERYKRPLIYWRILAVRLAFIVIYQNLIGCIQALLSWAVPDVPVELQKRIKREEYLLREYIIDYEKKAAVMRVASVTNPLTSSDNNGISGKTATSQV